MLDAGELCNRQVVIATPEEPILAAARRMRDHRVGCLVIVEGEPGRRRPIGILTDRDVVVYGVADGGTVAERTVGACMNPNLVTAREREGLLEVIRRMRVHGIRRIPVVDERGVLQGILSVDDVVDVLAEEVEALAAVLLGSSHAVR
jgi:CBS domain-containing protein